MKIIEFAEVKLGLRLSCLQQDLLLILEKDSDFIKYVKNDSQTMSEVFDVYRLWHKRQAA
ncbi:hypothetical protein NV379_02345 [Paenibacillus sp. N1-5-1-14]|uniref:hypothetical protein n=1 Tax=Paenibacillus radicibacter TaxID=2972488 RepID=UPI00215950B1|nr:hypothetical protein [Paenibacillus radicibacter]MCR8641487.1 hypothetical protein [Paenibacillus radicibacter]